MVSQDNYMILFMSPVKAFYKLYNPYKQDYAIYLFQSQLIVNVKIPDCFGGLCCPKQLLI